jgi:hypothetical protein
MRKLLLQMQVSVDGYVGRASRGARMAGMGLGRELLVGRHGLSDR